MVLYFAWQAEKKRREALMAWAAERGWSYHHHRDKGKVRQYGFLDRLQQGHSRSSSHRLKGEWRGRPAEAFQLRYVTGSGKNRQTHHWVVALLKDGTAVPGADHRAGERACRASARRSASTTSTSSRSSSRNAFAVRSRDKKLAYDFCNTGMMEYLLANRGTTLELEGDVLALLTRGSLKPERAGRHARSPARDPRVTSPTTCSAPDR